MTPKPYSEASERNKEPILAVLRDYFTGASFPERGTILEIGSGTGQHAVYFARQLPHLRWQPSDIRAHLDGIRQWLDDANLPNLNPVLELDVTRRPWPITQTDGVFSANTAHIMSWATVQDFIAGVGEAVNPGAYFCLYGPFTYKGQYTSASNAQFDASLRARDPAMGIRDFEAINEQAVQAGLEFIADHAMPANNRVLVWQRASGF